jgi:hypothetical protein
LGDRRNDGENNCNSGDGTGQMAQPWMFMMMMMMMKTIHKRHQYILNKIEHKITAGNAMLAQSDNGRTTVIIYLTNHKSTNKTLTHQTRERDEHCAQDSNKFISPKFNIIHMFLRTYLSQNDLCYITTQNTDLLT